MYDPERYHRRSIRLRGYDYRRPGAYFITIVVQGRTCLFGEISKGVMQLNTCGEVLQESWHNLPNHYSYVKLDAFVVMPNHVHGVVMLRSKGDRPQHGLPDVVRSFKAFSARRVNALRGTEGQAFWPRNYYEHIVRDEQELNRIRQYIETNPFNWEKDPENPKAR